MRTTDRELAAVQAALREAQDLIRIAPAYFGFLSPEGAILSLNDLALAVIGASREQVVGRRLWEVPWWSRLPESAARVREAVADAARGAPRQFDIEYWAPGAGQGERRWASLTLTPERDAGGAIQRIAATGIDITGRKSAERGAIAAHEQLEAFFMQAPLPMAILIGEELRFVLANPPYDRLVGRKSVGRTVREMFTEEEVGQYIQLLEGVLRTGAPYIGTEATVEIPDEAGRLRKLWLNFGYHPFRDADGKVKGILVIAQDVTELVQARHRLEKSERELRSFIEAMPQLAFIAAPDGSITYYNQRWYQYVRGIEGTEGWGWKDLPIHHPEDLQRTIRTWEESLRTGNDYEIEYRLRRYDGEYRWHLGRAVPVRDEAGKITRWIGTNTDIHDQKILHQKLEEERDLRERFVSMLSHDLRTPLTAAKMSAQVLARKPGDAEAVQRLASRIIASVDRADRMMRDLLDASLIGAGERLPIKPEACDLVQVASETLEELSTIHGDRFALRALGRLDGYWSPREISRVLENLASNAVKYGAANRPVTVTLSRIEGEALLEVHNEGAPIPPEEQAALFEPFRRSVAAQRGGPKGWGLGLTLVKGIAEAHGGSTGVISSTTEGTTFWVRLPLDFRSAPGLARGAGERGAGAKRGAGA